MDEVSKLNDDVIDHPACTWGYAKHPCTQSACSQGFAVRPIRPYGCTRIRLREGPLYTLIFESSVVAV